MKSSDFERRIVAGLKGIDFPSIGLCPTCPTCQRDSGLSPRAFYTAATAGTATRAEDSTITACQACGIFGWAIFEPIHGVADGKLIHVERACQACVLWINGFPPDEE